MGGSNLYQELRNLSYQYKLRFICRIFCADVRRGLISPGYDTIVFMAGGYSVCLFD
jgi:hypothetical protein